MALAFCLYSEAVHGRDFLAAITVVIRETRPYLSKPAGTMQLHALQVKDFTVFPVTQSIKVLLNA
jgi:hypothetical protein